MRFDPQSCGVSNQDIQRQLDIIKNLDTSDFQSHYISSQRGKWSSPRSVYSSSVSSFDVDDTSHRRYVSIHSPSNNASEKLAEFAFIRWRTYSRRKKKNRKRNAMQIFRWKRMTFRRWVHDTRARLLVVRYRKLFLLQKWLRWTHQQQKVARYFERRPRAQSVAIRVRKKQNFHGWRRLSVSRQHTRQLLALFASSRAQGIRSQTWKHLRLHVVIARLCRNRSNKIFIAWMEFTEYKIDRRFLLSTSMDRVALCRQRGGLNRWRETLCRRNEERHRCALVGLYISRRMCFSRWLGYSHTHQRIVRFLDVIQKRSRKCYFTGWTLYMTAVNRGRILTEKQTQTCRKKCLMAWKDHCVHSRKIRRAHELLDSFYLRRTWSTLRSWLESQKTLRRWIDQRKWRDTSRWWQLGWKRIHKKRMDRNRVTLRLLEKRGLCRWKAYSAAQKKRSRRIQCMQERIAQAICRSMLARWRIFQCRQQRMRQLNEQVFRYSQNLLRYKGIQRLWQAAQQTTVGKLRFHAFRRRHRALRKRKMLLGWRVGAHSRRFDRQRVESLQKYDEVRTKKLFISQCRDRFELRRRLERFLVQIVQNRLGDSLWKWRIYVHQRVTVMEKRHERRIKLLCMAIRVWKSVITHQSSKRALKNHIGALVAEKRLQSALSRWKELRYAVSFDQIHTSRTGFLLRAGWSYWREQYADHIQSLDADRKRRILQGWNRWAQAQAIFIEKHQIFLQKLPTHPKCSIFYRQWSRWRWRTQCLKEERRVLARIKVLSLELFWIKWHFLHRFKVIWRRWRYLGHHRAFLNKSLRVEILQLWYTRWKVRFAIGNAPKIHHKNNVREKIFKTWWKWTVRRLQERLIQVEDSDYILPANRSNKYLDVFQRRNMLRVDLQGSPSRISTCTCPLESLKPESSLMKHRIVIPRHRKYPKRMVRSRSKNRIRKPEREEEKVKTIRTVAEAHLNLPSDQILPQSNLETLSSDSLVDSQRLLPLNHDSLSTLRDFQSDGISLQSLANCKLYDEIRDESRQHQQLTKTTTRVHAHSVSLAEIIGITDSNTVKSSQQRCVTGKRPLTSSKKTVLSEQKRIQFRTYSKDEILLHYASRVLSYQAENDNFTRSFSGGLKAIAFEAVRDFGLFRSKMYLPNFLKLLGSESIGVEAQESMSKSRLLQSLKKILSHVIAKSQGYRAYLRSINEQPKEPLDWYLSRPLPDTNKVVADAAPWVTDPLPPLFITAFEKFEMCIQRYWRILNNFFAWHSKDQRTSKEVSKAEIPRARFLLLFQHLNIVPQLFGRREVETFMDQSCSPRARMESSGRLCLPETLFFSEYIETLIRCAWTLRWSPDISSAEEKDGTVQVVQFVMLIFAMEGSGSILHLQAEDVDVVMKFFQRKRASARHNKSVAFRQVLHDSSRKMNLSVRTHFESTKIAEPERNIVDNLMQEDKDPINAQSRWQCASLDTPNESEEKDPFFREILTSFGEIEAQLARYNSPRARVTDDDVVRTIDRG
uniref:Uncharacterized protein AlNc14C22G2267 n=1 Tax=Albugo laibachii Nc14 TaxID=890382 RepID=F0W5V2_9STRA|nr:hypothetical protein PITG_18074 [Albugo laibachii Nc14]|eukprot:CCA16493.1 hypothetical protein PITG_18074 [Albugo laibachii Nc14]